MLKELILSKNKKIRKNIYKINPKQLRKWQEQLYIFVITLKANGLNAPTKRHRLAEWVQKQDPYLCCLQETQFRPKI